MANVYNNKIVLASGEVLIDLTADTVDADHLLTGATAHDKSGAPIEGRCSYDSDTSDDTVAVSEILAGKTAHARGAQLSGTMPNIGAVSGIIDTKSGAYTVPQGYHDGSGTVAIAATEQAKLVPSNIRKDVTILGVTGTMSGSESEKKQAKSVTPTFAQQTILPDATYTCLSQVTVAAIPVSYSDNSAGGKTVTIGGVA